MRARQPFGVALVSAVVLAIVYAATGAPDVTFWDAGELIAAIHSLGIPHPPGTPLFIVAARAWSDALGFLPRALATNLFSAACSASACGALAWLFARATRRPLASIAAALCAGATSTVWSNATETEVYAASLALAAAMLVTGFRAGEERDVRWRLLLAFLFGLAVPLHLSALVAAPAAIVLACEAADRRDRDWRGAAALAAALVLCVAIGVDSRALIGVAVVALAASATALVSHRERRVEPAALAALALLGVSALAIMRVRAAHDPVVNEGNAASWTAMWDVVARRQYAVQGLWPRQAPLWLQLGNWFEYADWQFALAFAPGAVPTVARTVMTLVFGALGAVGSIAHRRADRRTWSAFVLLGVCASAGLVAYLNLKAGPTYGYGVLADAAPREARDRDYFFALAFWVWGAWAGFGAVMLMRARRFGRPIGLSLALGPMALNWHAMSRRREPERSGARAFAEALLWSVPPDGVLVTAGDNDSFPLWYAQTVLGFRRDVSVVVAPLLGADWYRAQLERRQQLLDRSHVTRWAGERATLDAIAHRAALLHRPLVVSIAAGADLRAALGSPRMLRGLALVAGPASVDSAAARAFVERFGGRAPLTGTTLAVEAVDPAPGQMSKLLRCPAHALVGGPSSLDSLCNSR
ncbi:MAG: DUF2723 domain-containing protein [Gemmatimonadaceae bacterium]